MNWADSKNSVNSVEPHAGNTEPRLRSTREGVETRHGESTKVCFTCKGNKPLSEYYHKDRATGRLDSTCKSCRIIQLREKVLGITEAEYRDLYWKQNGKCGICQKRMYTKRYKKLAVDHCHKTGRIRGLLCSNCNTGLGLFKECPVALLRAIDWIKV